MDTVKLSIKEREQTGNGPARRLRADGRLPGVVYAKGPSPRPSRSTWASSRRPS